jgi:hypothetical protein
MPHMITIYVPTERERARLVAEAKSRKVSISKYAWSLIEAHWHTPQRRNPVLEDEITRCNVEIEKLQRRVSRLSEEHL